MNNSYNLSVCRRAINFDLDTAKMLTATGSMTRGYKKLEKSFKKEGFEHIQGSGYVSKKPLTTTQLMDTVDRIVRNNFWIGSCVKSTVVTNVEDIFDITNSVRKTAKAEQKKQTRKQKANAQAAVSQGSGKPAPKASTAQKSVPQTKKSPAKQMTTQKKIDKGFSL